MTTSGTIDSTTVDVTAVIEKAVRRCGVPPSAISGEVQLSAKEDLFLLLSHLVTKGLNLFCVSKYLLPLAAGQAAYALPAGTEKVLNAQMRSATLYDATPGVGVSTLSLGAATQMTGAKFTVPTAGTYSFIAEYSSDGATWNNAGTLAAAAYTLGQRVAMEFDYLSTVAYYRLRDAGGVLTLTTPQFLGVAQDVPMSPLNRDDYTSLPNKASASLNPLQYWLDKQLRPRVVLWPIPQDSTRVMVVYAERLIQDAGTFTNTLELPSRWLDHAIYALGMRLCHELPPPLVPPGRYEELKLRAAETLESCADSETDGAPLRLVPNIRGYTR